MSAPSYSDSPRNVTNYLGQNYRFAPVYIRKRNPVNGTSQQLLGDVKPKENQGRYPIGSIWVNTVAPEIWILSEINVNGAQWILLANGLITGPLLTLSDNTGLVVPPSTDVSNPPGNIQFLAGAGISIVGTPASNLITITNTGIASNFAPDTGTNPVSGSTVTFTNTSILATGTLANALRSNGTGASTIAYQTQFAGSNAGSSTANNFGVSQFDSNEFTVTGGFVQLKNNTLTGTATTVGAVTGNISTSIPIPSNSATSIRVSIAGWEGGGGTGLGGELIGLARNVAGTVTIIGVPDVTRNNDTALAAWGVTLVASGTNAIVQVTGVAGKTINWRAFIDVVSAP